MDTPTNTLAQLIPQPVIQPPASNPGNTTDTSNGKLPKRRIKKLTAAEIGNLPGAVAIVEKKVEPDLAYYLFFFLPVTGPVGSVTEANQVHDFAYQLDVQAKAKDVGAVKSVGVTDGLFEVVLQLSATGEQSSYGAPATGAFTKLEEFLKGAVQLSHGPAGKPATWKAKVNGTTIVVGACVFQQT